MRIRFRFGNAKSRPFWWGIERIVLLWLLSCWRLSLAQNIEVIDNNDSRVRYGEGWKDVPGAYQHNGSVMLTRNARAFARVSFQGIGISVYGTQGTSGGNVTKSLYVIDTASPVQYVVPSTLREIQYQVPFYQSPQLPDKEHTLLVMNENEDGWYWLDYFKVTSAGAQMATPASTIDSRSIEPTSPILLRAIPRAFHHSRSHTLSTVSPTPSNPSTSSTPLDVLSSSNITGSQASTSNAPSQVTSSRSVASPGAVAGIVISSIILVSVGVFVICWRVRHRSIHPETSEAQNIDPFYRSSGTNAGPVIHGISTPYTVEHFPAPGINLPPPPRLPPEKGSSLISPQLAYPLNYYEQYGRDLPPGAGTPQVGLGMFQSFGTASRGVMGNQGQGQGQATSLVLGVPATGFLDPQRTSFLSTNGATYGSENPSRVQHQSGQTSHRPVLLS